jgi:UDP-glucose 4-epimerase
VLSGTERILITGGAGLIGSHVADLLVRQYNPEIVILDNFSRGRRDNLRWSSTHGRVEVVEEDIRHADTVYELMTGVDVVFHLVGLNASQCSEDPRLGVEVLGNGTFNVLEAAALSGVRKIVAASSTAIYGAAERFPTPEEHHPYNNRTLVGATEIFSEALLRSFQEMYGTSFVALRYATVYGPRMGTHGTDADMLIRWMERLAQRHPCVIGDDGSQRMDLIYVDDIAQATILAAESEISGEILNIGSGREITLAEVAVTLGQIMGSHLSPEYNAAGTYQAVDRRFADTSKAMQLLRFRPQVPLEEGLRRLVSWWERHRIVELEMA